MRKTRLIALVVAGAWLAGTGTASATLVIQKKAKEAGYEAKGCVYCHNEKLPKKGAVTYNDRGQHLVDQKKKHEAKDIDVNWLKDYVEKDKKSQ
jgi:hypothetical protein